MGPPRGWSIFPRPALRENAENPRSPVAARRLFLREIGYQHPLIQGAHVADWRSRYEDGLRFFPCAKVAGRFQVPVDRDLSNSLTIFRHLPDIPDDRPQSNSQVDRLDAPHNIRGQRSLQLLAA